MKVAVSDIIIPALFQRYMNQRSVELSTLVQSGIITADAEFNGLASGGGRTVDMPFWNDIDGDDEVISDDDELTPGKIDTGRDVAIINQRGRAWSTNDLAGIMAGSDPMKAIADRVAEYWVRRRQAYLLAMLRGVFGSSTMNSNKADLFAVSGTPGSSNFLTGSTFIDVNQLLGDHKQYLAAVIMHSAVEASLRKLDLIDTIRDSAGVRVLNAFQGLEVIVDDGVPTETINGATVYHTFLCAKGAVALGLDSSPRPIEGAAGKSDWYVETARAALAGDSYLINRQRFIMHIRGVKWTDSDCTGQSPTNTELSNSANFSRVYAAKNVRILRVRHNIANA